ncbi:hypothetical protein HOD20_08205 [archaeon]|jgi:hypothetical protein|nr:hypothetical protein [archaeon]MBT4647191.1 hypothetical protein [archaeon]MBT6822194.1 hypothetical protein [archaeon]MBT7391731.1 hypothetical protein [archaeon]
MATLFDFAFLDNFSSIFVLLFIIVAIYAILTARKVFGGNSSLNFTIAFAIGMIFIFNKGAIDAIRYIIPWITFVIIAFVMILIGITVFVGADPISWLKTMGYMGTWYNFVFVISLVIIALGVSNSVGQNVGPFLGGGNESISLAATQAAGTGDVASDDFSQNLGATLFHPKVLSLILVFFILSMAAMYITKMG